MRMFELRFLSNYGEASFRIARLEYAGKGTRRATQPGALFFRLFLLGKQKKEVSRRAVPGPLLQLKAIYYWIAARLWRSQ
jgi:hypothetical protein